MKIFYIAYISFCVFLISYGVYNLLIEPQTTKFNIGQTWEYRYDENPFSKNIDTFIIVDIKGNYIQYYSKQYPEYLRSHSKRYFLVDQTKISDTPLIK